jgi:hypothetical protein
MVRSLALGFGMVTALAVAGSMTPAGQGMLGQRHPTENVVQVSSIQDKPVAIPGPAQSLVATSAAPTAAPAAAPVGVASPTSTVPQAPRRPQAAPTAARPQAGAAPRTKDSLPPQAGQAQGGPGGMAGIANILLNLPQVLDQTHVGPSHGSDSWSESKPAPEQRSGKPHKWRHAQGEDQKEPSENH